MNLIGILDSGLRKSHKQPVAHAAESDNGNVGAFAPIVL